MKNIQISKLKYSEFFFTKQKFTAEQNHNKSLQLKKVYS